MIRVAIVDDHALVRHGLEQLLSTVDDLEVVGTASDGADARALVAQVSPDVVLMDLDMPGLDGVAAAREVVQAHPDVRIVILTAFSERERVLAALDAGAIGYLLKDADPEELLAGVRAAARGESPLASRAATALVEARSVSAASGLTDREREILELVAGGLPNKLIARRLGIAEKTVKTHLTSAFRRIGVTDRTQAALWVARNGA
ncbi:MAG: response regulator transcription factor [Thermoleophilia bacterium]